MSLASKRALVTSDWHVPFFDRRAFGQFLHVVQTRKPHLIILNGDLVDFYPISTHLRHPARQLSLQDEIDTLRILLQILRETAPRARIVYLLGNHEERFIKYLWRERSELLPLRALTLPSLLGLADLKIELHPFPIWFLLDDCVVTHGNISRKRSGYMAHAMLDRFGFCSGVSGHTHRLACVHRRLPSGQVLTWVEAGALCQLQASYAPCPDWQHGLGWMEFDSRGRLAQLDSVLLQETDKQAEKYLPASEPVVMLTSGLQEVAHE